MTLLYVGRHVARSLADYPEVTHYGVHRLVVGAKLF
jgi:hypothetical protein